MPKIDKHRRNQDLQRLARQFAVVVDVGFFVAVTYVLASMLDVSGRLLLKSVFLRTGLSIQEYSDHPCGVLFANACWAGALVWPLVLPHYAGTHNKKWLLDVLVAKSNSKQDRRNIWKYLLSILWMGATIIAAGDAAGLLAYLISGDSPWTCGISWIIGAGIATLLLYLRSWFRLHIPAEPDTEDSPIIRGTLLNTFKDATTQSLTLLAHANHGQPLHERSYSIRWAGVELPANTESHFGIVGINGSGKTLALQKLMRSVIPTVRDSGLAPTAQRALVFDPENKLIPFLQELAGPENVQILNPFDARSQPWDLASDIEDLATAQEMASIFIAEQQGDSAPFWQRTARGILSAVLKALHMKAPGKWTLRQVFLIMTNEPRLTAVLKSTNQTQGLIDLLKPTNQTLFNVLAELRSHMDMLELVAALWDSSVRDLGKKPFTLKAWLSGHGVLVFGRPTQLEDTILALNRVLVKRASQLIRAPIPKEEADARGRTWIFLDELRNIGNLPGLDKLLTEGRSRGARVVIAFQDIDGLREVYGERVAEEIANQCDTMSYLRCRGTTAKWAAERLGRSEYWDRDFSSGRSSGEAGISVSSGTNTRKNITDAVLESELSGLSPVTKQPVDGKAGGYIQGWHVIPAIERIYPTREKDAWYAFENMDAAERFRPRRPEDQILRPWDDERDWNELGFRPDMPTGPFTLPNVDDLRG